MVSYLSGTCLRSTTVTRAMTSSRGVQMASRCLENSDRRERDNNDRAPSSSSADTTRASDSSGNTKEANASGKNDTDFSVDERLDYWKKNVKLDTLTHAQRVIHNCHLKAVEESRETYKDPVTGYEVFTILTHLKRGSCCGNMCRHCPYTHVNVPPMTKGQCHYNSAFYSSGDYKTI